jgi:hypothetical protein
MLLFTDSWQNIGRLSVSWIITDVVIIIIIVWAEVTLHPNLLLCPSDFQVVF